MTANTYYLYTIVRIGSVDSVYTYLNGVLSQKVYDPSFILTPMNSTAQISFFVDNSSNSSSYYCEDGPGSISYLSLSNSSFTASQVDSTWNAQCPAILPLQLLDFYANKDGNEVSLSWKTASEINTSHFELERGEDGRIFDKIASIAANNNTSTNAYNFTDRQPLPNNFYRLKIVDKDGNFKYSGVLKINFTGVQKLEAFPNPTNSELTISGLKSNEQVKLLSSDGKLLIQKRASGQSMTIDMSRFSTGLYILQYSDGSTINNQKIIKK
jgi:hypothetical protein